MNQQISIDTLPKKTAKLLATFSNTIPKFLNSFYLSGGTALSLQLGHRESEDLDFFSQKAFNPQLIQQNLLKYGNLTQTELAKGTVNTFLGGVKLQFLEYPYDLIKPLMKWESIQLSSIEDIACTKLQTIGMRGSKKDFIDIYFLLEKYSLTDMFELMKTKYTKVDYSTIHIMKSLVYFEDADHQPMPRMHKTISWSDVKKTMIKAVKEIQFE